MNEKDASILNADTTERLLQLYQKASKHSNYQVPAKVLLPFIPVEKLNIVSRYERERMDYIAARLTIRDKTILDIGGNTGYFSLECASRGAAKILYCEGNAAHCEFVRAAIQLTQMDKVVQIIPGHIAFQDDIPGPADMALLLNVLHHVGDDYGDSNMGMACAKDSILAALRHMARRVQYLVFQMGYNWKGQRNLPLFENGLKCEQIEFIRTGLAAEWDILHIGIAEEMDGATVYRDMTDVNLRRLDALGEFRNRPIFIMRSKC